MPAFTTVLVLAFVASWNNYFLPLVVLNSSEHFPVTVGLAQWYAAATAGSGGDDPLHRGRRRARWSRSSR